MAESYGQDLETFLQLFPQAREAYDQAYRPVSIMKNTYIYVAGELSPWPAKDYLAGVLRSAAGLNIYVGQYSIRVEDCSHFFFENYGGDIERTDH